MPELIVMPALELNVKLMLFAARLFFFLGRAEPDFIALTVQKATDIELVVEGDGIRDQDTSFSQRAFGLRRIFGGNRDAWIRFFGRGGIPVCLEHQNRLAKKIADLLTPLIRRRQPQSAFIECVGAIRIVYAESNYLYTLEAEGGGTHKLRNQES